MPRFVLLYHDCPTSFGTPSHWDLMLQRDGALMTWRLAALPAAWQRPQTVSAEEIIDGDELAAVRMADHRLAYLDYEGPVSGDRGQVTRVDRGEYAVVEESVDWLHVQLAGAKAVGRVRLPIAPPPTESDSPRLA